MSDLSDWSDVSDENENEDDVNDTKPINSDKKDNAIPLKSKGANSKNSIRQFYRWKNKIGFKPIENSKEPHDVDQSGRPELCKAYLTSQDGQSIKIGKKIKHSRDPLQERDDDGPIEIIEKQKTKELFRKVEYIKQRNNCCNWHCISNNTFLGHSQYQVILMFVVLDLVAVLGILVFLFRGDVSKLLPPPTEMTSKKFIVGDLEINKNGFTSKGKSTTFVVNSSFVVDNSIINRENGSVSTVFKMNGPLSIGDISFSSDSGGFKMDSQANGSLNIAGHLVATNCLIFEGDIEIGGLFFNQNGCLNCVTDTNSMSSSGEVLLENFEQEILKFVPKFHYLTSNDQIVIGDDKTICFNEKCQETDQNIIPLRDELFVPAVSLKLGTVLHAQDYFDEKILRICVNNSNKAATFSVDELVIITYDFIPKCAFIAPKLNTEIYQILTDSENFVYVYSKSGTYSKRKCKFGSITKIKAILTDNDEYTVFLQTEKGVVTFRILDEEEEKMELTEMWLQFPGYISFDATIRDSDSVLIVGANEDGYVQMGRCSDDLCNEVRMLNLRPFFSQHSKIEFVGVSIGPDNFPSLVLSRNGETRVIRCQSHMCTDIDEPVW